MSHKICELLYAACDESFMVNPIAIGSIPIKSGTNCDKQK